MDKDPFPDGPVWTALAPMQDVTTLEFMRVIAHYGAPDLFFTEYFRVHQASTLEKHILRSVTENQTGQPVFAQMIGESIPDLIRTALALEQHPCAGIDLNMGCPAPKVYRKNVGGGLLRDPDKIEEIIDALSSSLNKPFTVKMRFGFEDDRHFERILDIINRYPVKLLSLHGRTVKGLYRSPVDYGQIAKAVRSVSCPVLANGNVTSLEKSQAVLNETGARGVMIGRHAIRYPWIFRDIHRWRQGLPQLPVSLAEVRDYAERLHQACLRPEIPDRALTNHLKKFLNFVGQGVDPEGAFLHAMRRAQSSPELFSVLDQHLIHGDRAHQIFPPEPFHGVIARPNCESPEANESPCASSA